MSMQTVSPGAMRRGEERDFRLIFMASFLLFLCAALAARLMPRTWRPAGMSGRRSVLEEARAAANNAIPFAFMS